MLSCAALLASTAALAQMENSIKLNEVVTDNRSGLQDEYGQRGAWLEIANISHSTYNIRGMFVTTDRSVLDKNMSAPERMSLMSVIPNGDERTNLSARQNIVFYLNSAPAKGSLHLTVKVEPGKPTWLALYNGNGVDLIDSVTIPALAPDCSFARTADTGHSWESKTPDAATPWISNNIAQGETKVAKVKRTDPHGVGIAVLSMGIVFFCLALLYAFFAIFGTFMQRRESAKPAAPAQAKPVEAEPGKGGGDDVYMAVIAMALKQYRDNVHDPESGIITIRPKQTEWNVEFLQMTQFHE